jgi:acyl carrier protein
MGAVLPGAAQRGPGLAVAPDMSTGRAVRQVLRDYGRLGLAVEDLCDDDDLYLAGITSQASVNVMLGLEAALDIEFPEHMLRKSTFASIRAITDAVASLRRS